jgi:glycogen debranching enzyme
MPDKWEYPWYAAWDLAFHCIPLALVDPDFAKQQLTLLVREWYMHPNGQLPAYEWQLSDVNPPVHAWAAFRVYRIERRVAGRADRAFLEAIFHKLMLNFTWWVNRKDTDGRNVFEGGFLGLDNVGVFDRSKPLPGGGVLEQADATAWMGMYCLNMLDIALELARENPSYQDVANKFFEHFLNIAHAMHHIAGQNVSLWDEEDGFYYDVMRRPTGESFPVRVRSIVGLTPLFATATLEPETMERFPAFWRRARWFLEARPELGHHCEILDVPGHNERRLLSLVERDKLPRVLERVLSEEEFLSPYGVRSLSRAHARDPFVTRIDGQEYRVDYEPAESRTGLFGGNSNWRGPVWLPVNYLLVESLQRLHHYYGDALRVRCPTQGGREMTLWEVSTELSRRLIGLFVAGADGRRPAHGPSERVQRDPHFKDLVTFYEYFHGDTGEGLGARAQTGWTALVAKLLEQSRLWRA